MHNTGQAYPIPGGGTDTGTPGSDVDAPEAWDVYAPPDPVIVAIVDSGVDYNHPDLASRMWTDPYGYYGYDFRNDDFDPMDDMGHGTHCAGIVAAGFNNRIGISGLCPNARIMALKFAGEDGRGSAEDAAAAIYYAVNNGTDIISNSYGYDAPSETLESAIEYSHSQGVIIVASAGNEECAKPHYPASYEPVIAVAATSSHDVKRTSSSYGSWVDISAPGSDILSLRATGTDMYGNGEHIVDTDYYIASGTSMACPHVVGVAALILSHYPDLSSEEIMARLLGTTDAIATQNPLYAHLIGSGRVNAYNALADEEHPGLVFADYEILDGSLGNGNGVLDPGETAFLSVTLTNIWADATNVQATLTSADGRVFTISATSHFGDIASGQEGGNEHDPFEVQLSSGVASVYHAALFLDVGTAGGYTRRIGFVVTNEAQLQDGGWPKYFGRYVEPIPYDVDGDGITELLISDGRDVHITVPNGDVTAILPGGEDGIGHVAAGDLQRDGHVEIVAVREREGTGYRDLCLWGKDGNQIVPPVFLEPAQYGGSPTLYDLDGDGDLEVVVEGIGAAGDCVIITSLEWQEDGLQTQWQALFPTSERHTVTAIAVGNIDAGSPDAGERAELVFATYRRYSTQGNKLFALNSYGEPLDGWPVTLASTGHGLVLADLTGDGNLEIIYNTPDSESGDGLHVWDHTGSLLWTGSGWNLSPAVADLDGDGDLEVLTPTKAYHHDGTDTGWSYFVASPGGGASVGDIDGDGSMEVLIGGGGGLSVFRHNGTPLQAIPRAIDPEHPHTSMTPVLADLDGDGDIEITVTGTYFAVWDLYGQYDRANIEWSMYRHDPYRTGCYNPDFNLPPVWYTAPEDRVFVRTETSEFCIKATDPEGKSVEYDIENMPPGAQSSLHYDGLLFYWRPAMSDVSQDITFCATDEDGERIAKIIHIEVVDPPIDLDGDGDLDLVDHSIFTVCLNGPDRPPAYPGCDIADIDDDADVDMTDFARLQKAFGAL